MWLLNFSDFERRMWRLGSVISNNTLKTMTLHIVAKSQEDATNECRIGFWANNLKWKGWYRYNYVRVFFAFR
jgi:hypothetical protein